MQTESFTYHFSEFQKRGFIGGRNSATGKTDSRQEARSLENRTQVEYAQGVRRAGEGGRAMLFRMRFPSDDIPSISMEKICDFMYTAAF